MARMCLISVPNLKAIHPGEDCFWLKIVVVNRCEEGEEKCEENWAIFRIAYLTNYLSDFFQIILVCKIVYMEGITYINLIEIGPVVMEI